MKYVVRRNVFETNSSSTHSVTIFNNDLKDRPKILSDDFEKLNFLYRYIYRLKKYKISRKFYEEKRLECNNLFAKKLKIDINEATKRIDDYFSSNPRCPVCNKKHTFGAINCPINNFDYSQKYLDNDNFFRDIFNNKIFINILYERSKYNNKIKNARITISNNNIEKKYITDPFYKLMFMVASNEYKIAKTKNSLCYTISKNVLFEGNRKYTYEYLDLLPKLLKYKCCTPKIFKEIFGQYTAIKNDNLFLFNLEHRSNSNLKSPFSEPDYKPIRKKLINSKLNSMRYKGKYYPNYLFNSITILMNTIYEMEKYYSIFIDAYVKVTREKREDVINKLKSKNRNKDYNPLTFTPMCINFFCEGPLYDECIDCNCHINDIIDYIREYDYDVNMSRHKQIKSKVMKIFNNEVLINFREGM